MLITIAGSLWHKDGWLPCAERIYNRRSYNRAGSLWHKITGVICNCNKWFPFDTISWSRRSFYSVKACVLVVNSEYLTLRKTDSRKAGLGRNPRAKYA